MKGVKPVLRLTTSDGAIYESSDPLNLAFSETAPLASTVLEWIMPPLSQRYLEACATSKVGELNISKGIRNSKIKIKINLHTFPPIQLPINALNLTWNSSLQRNR